MKISTGWGFAIAGVLLAVGWEALPGAHVAIVVFVLILVFALWLSLGGTVISQIDSLVGAKVP